MRILAGCDGGGSKCEVVVRAFENDGTVLNQGIAVGGSANANSNLAEACNTVVQVTLKARKESGVEAEELEHMVVALAGTGKTEIRVEVKRRLIEALPVRAITVVPDAGILFAAALTKVQRASAALATIVGTGSIAWAKDRGRFTRAGGLGPKRGDEGSAYWIGKAGTYNCTARAELQRRSGTRVEREA